MKKPTLDMYTFVQKAFDHFNIRLFDSMLPQPLLTFQREKKVFGYFSPRRWQHSDGARTHEIALNPMYFVTHNPLELMQTLVHEMCHLWQYEFGNPGRGSYHNKEWADKMESIGLMPSDSGAPGGKKTGQHMSDYPLPGGLFFNSCVLLAAGGYNLPCVDAFYLPKEDAQIRQTSQALLEELAAAFNMDPAQIEANVTTEALDDETSKITLNIPIADALSALQAPFSEQFVVSHNDADREAYQAIAAKKAKVCYHCRGCGIKLWGKPDLYVVCGECELPLVV